MASSNTVQSYLGDYANIRTIPGVLSVAFVVATVYMFGGIETLTFAWFGYTIQPEHMMLLTLGTYAVAFASSETKRFENYEDWEKAVIAAGPAIIFLYEYLPAFVDLLDSIGTPLGHQLAALICLVSWGVAVQ